jgi:FxsC-like protein
MGYHFFFSYKRISRTVYQRKFFDELSAEVREVGEVEQEGPVGFFDQEGIEPGEEWRPELSAALQDSKVLVCVFTPHYFKSEYCGKEWQVFQMRRMEHQRLRQAEGVPDPQLPPVIKPVLWIPVSEEELSSEVREIQLYRGTRENIANSRGLRYVLKQKSNYRRLYQDYLNRLAQDIVDAAKCDLKPLPALPDLRDIPVPAGFKSCETTARKSVEPLVGQLVEPQPRPSTILYPSVKVKFVFVAGDPARFGGLRQPDSYLERGGADWKPFHPTQSDRIARIINRFISDEEGEYDVVPVPYGDDLITVVEEAYSNREIVVIIADAWTITWDVGFQSILRDFDTRNRQSPFYNCSVLVPWNESDLEIRNRRDEILETVRNTFYSRSQLFKNPVFYRDSITSVDQLIVALRDALTNIRTELHQRVAERKPVPAGISKPIVSNESQPIARSV